ncbi:MAG: hypothetical protein WCK35_24675 [Chloroflexota bacterium]
MNKNPLHLVIRFSDSMFDVGNVVSIHNEIVSQFGSVWFGKLGQTISQARADLLNQQIEKNIPTWVYLVKGNRKKSTPFRAALKRIEKTIPTEKAFIPAYYFEKDLTQFMKVWIKIGGIEPLDISEMEKLKAINSIFPITETLALSSSGYFLVHESSSIF